MISEIIAILLFLLIFNMYIIFSILAVIFSIVQKQYKFTTDTKVGLILGILRIIIYFIVGYASFAGPYSETTNGNPTN